MFRETGRSEAGIGLERHEKRQIAAKFLGRDHLLYPQWDASD